MIETGKILQQRYRIDRQIGQGGMGAVYVATDERFGSTVAIKETLFMDDNYRKAIEREARLLNSLKHAALPRVSDHFLEENVQFLVMEFIPGDDLAAIIERDHKAFSLDDVLKWADQLLEALDFLHNQDIPVIHRDIKPQNLKVTPRGQIILLDFGLAKGNPTDAGHQTAAKSIFGYSRNYASLEQIQGTGTDPRSDLYSLAATLYHLMTGVAPEDALTRAMSVLSQKEDPLVLASLVQPKIPKGVAVVLQKAMDLNADLRPQSAAEMRQMLREHENYSYLADTLGSRIPVTNADLFSQKTKLMGGDTQHDAGGQTDVKTEVLPAYISEETSIRQASSAASAGSTAVGLHSPTTAPAGKPRIGFWKIATALLGLLIIGYAAAEVYVYNPAIFGSATGEPPATEQVPVVEPVEQPNALAESDSNSSIENSAAVGEASQDAKAKPETPSKPAETSKTTKPAANDSDDENVDLGDVKVQGDTVYVGNMKIKNGKIETPDTYVDENGIRRKVPTPPGGYPVRPLTREQIQALTDAQRRKLRILRRNMQKYPPPQSTPPNQ